MNTSEYHRRIVDLAAELGATVTRTRNSHYKIVLPNGRAYFAGSTPGDHRSWDNLRAGVRRLARATSTTVVATAPTVVDDEVVVPAADVVAHEAADLGLDADDVVDPLTQPDFGHAIAAARTNEGLTRAELAELLDVHDSAVGQWERNVNTPTQDHYDRLCALLPILAEYRPAPHVRSMVKPGPTAGAVRDPVTDHVVAPPLPAIRDLVAEAGAALAHAKLARARLEPRLAQARAALAEVEAEVAAADTAVAVAADQLDAQIRNAIL